MVATDYDVPLEIVCNVTAILSPMTSWELNQKYTVKAIAQWKNNKRKSVHMFPTNTNKAYQILDGKAIELGQKTGPFAHNLCYPNTSTEVTIDSIAYRILIGMHYYSGTYKIALSECNLAKVIYTEVAQELNMLPSELQAMVWVQARKERQFSIIDIINNPAIDKDNFDPYTLSQISEK